MFYTGFSTYSQIVVLPKTTISMYYRMYDVTVSTKHHVINSMAKTIKCEGTFVDCFVVVCYNLVVERSHT